MSYVSRVSDTEALLDAEESQLIPELIEAITRSLEPVRSIVIEWRTARSLIYQSNLYDTYLQLLRRISNVVADPSAWLIELVILEMEDASRSRFLAQLLECPRVAWHHRVAIIEEEIGFDTFHAVLGMALNEILSWEANRFAKIKMALADWVELYLNENSTGYLSPVKLVLCRIQERAFGRDPAFELEVDPQEVREHELLCAAALVDN